MSLLSKNNGCAFDGTDRMLENGTLGKRSSIRTCAHPPELAAASGGNLPGHNDPGNIIYQCPQGGQPAPCGAKGHGH